jgi:hypothetical protein
MTLDADDVQAHQRHEPVRQPENHQSEEDQGYTGPSPGARSSRIAPRLFHWYCCS